MDHRPQFENLGCGGEQEAGFWKGLVGLLKAFQFHPQNSGNLLNLSREVCDMNRIDVCFQKTPRLLLHGINSRGAGVEVDRTVGKHGHLAGRR